MQNPFIIAIREESNVDNSLYELKRVKYEDISPVTHMYKKIPS